MSGRPNPKRGSKPLPREAIDDAKRETLFGTGYGRPPREHRFTKGKSGNPKGRPKLTPVPPSSNGLILEEGNRLLKVQEQGVTSQVTTFKAIVRSQVQAAVKGNAYAQRIFIEGFKEAEAEKQRMVDEENGIWRNYCNRMRPLFELAEAKGDPPPEVWPHPDDVVIDPKKGVRFIGPWDEESAADLQETLKLRDVLLVQDAWDDSCGRGEGEYNQTTAGLVATMLNEHVPARYRLSDFDYVSRVSRLRGTSKRELRKMLYRGFKDIGQHWTPNLWYPSIAAFIRDCEALWAACRELENENDR
jgi:hypothetical protein